MHKSSVDPDCTGLFTSLFLDYLHEKETLSPFYQEYPRIENFRHLIQKRSFTNEKREILVQTLESQYKRTGIHENAKNNLERLRLNNTFTVTTGHQLNLCTGPMYFIYKIVSTINLADKLANAYPDHHFVPVYWMATEDHDFEEINHFNLDGNTHRWETGQNGAVGDFELDKGLHSLLNSIPGMPEFFLKAYGECQNLAEAVRHYINHLFGEKGLLVVDGNDKSLKRLFRPIIKEDLMSNISNDLVQDCSIQLESLGYTTQVNPREINFFYMEKGLRERIVRNGEGFEVLNAGLRFSKEEFLHLVETAPEKFSPNVILRPLYQECILPNLAYIGGPAEVAYWFQLKSLFGHYKVDYPAILPRNFVLIFRRAIERKISKLDLKPEDLFKPFQLLKKDFVNSHSRRDLKLVREKTILQEIFSDLSAGLNGFEPSLKHSAEAAKNRVGKIMDHFAGKIRKAEERNFETAIRQLQEIKAFMAPGGTPQERKINFLNFFLEDPDFVEKLFKHLDPLDFYFIILTEDAFKKETSGIL